MPGCKPPFFCTNGCECGYKFIFLKSHPAAADRSSEGGPIPMATKHRLVTRSDFDGLVCAVLLKELDIIDDIVFVHPKDMQDGKVVVKPGDITTNLPYVEGCHLVFDHHHSETIRLGMQRPSNHIIDASAPSAARVVFD